MSTFAQDLAFLRQHVETIELTNTSGASVAVVPQFQSRVMTSAAQANLPGNGWINRDLIARGETLAHINPFGGEDRFWMGPEGGQYSIFFSAGTPFDLDHWQTPAIIDTDSYPLISHSEGSASFRTQGSVSNTYGFPFDFQIDRTIRLLDPTPICGLEVVSFETENTLTNIGDRPWSKETGLLSIWILGMFKHTESSVVILPYREEGEGAIVNDAYFGKVPDDRLRIVSPHVFFRADGNYRSKIGLSPSRATSTMGSYDPGRNLLTVVEFTLPDGATDYVNSMWEHQQHPYAGDVSNSYNDGPPAPGAKPLGPFYELESSSPALALEPKGSATHRHRTTHWSGDRDVLLGVARSVLGCDLSVLASPGFWNG